ncbi:MAG: LysE family translocator [Mangrovicoccus sp.]
MSYELLTALILFVFAASITPGPNNLMLLASGANFGLRRSLPLMIGISQGHAFMALILGLGVAQIFALVTGAKLVLTLASILYMLYLAYKIATAAPPSEQSDTGHPLSFVQGAAFQLVNPKGWAMALTAVTIYRPVEGLAGAFVAWAVIATVNTVSVTTWAMLGQQTQRILTSPARLRLFNRSMAALLIMSLVPVVWQLMG